MDKFSLKVCNKDTKRKSLRHSLSIFIVNLRVSLDKFIPRRITIDFNNLYNIKCTKESS